jgi:hypothetical protein
LSVDSSQLSVKKGLITGDSKNDTVKPMSDEQNEEVYYTLEVVTGMTRLGTGIIERCVQVGIVHPVEAVRYSPADVARLRRARRYIYDFGLNWAGIELVMRLTDEMEQLRAEIARLHATHRSL